MGSYSQYIRRKGGERMTTQTEKKVYTLTLNSKIEDDAKLMKFLEGKRITDTLKSALHLLIEKESGVSADESKTLDLEGKVVLSDGQFEKMIDAITAVTNLVNSAPVVAPVNVVGEQAATTETPEEKKLTEEEQKVVEERAQKARGNLKRRKKD